MCEDDVTQDPDVKVAGGRFGEAQASLGLDRYSVGYDLPLPSLFDAAPGKDKEEVEVGGPVVETLADFPNQPQQKQQEALEGGGKDDAVSPGFEAGRMSERNETSSSTPLR